MSYLVVGMALCGCGRSGRWSFELENHSAERFSNVVLSCDGRSWPLPGDGGGGMGVNGDIPEALGISFTDKDGGRHDVRVTIPSNLPRRSGIPHVWLVIEGRDRVTAYASDPERN